MLRVSSLCVGIDPIGSIVGLYISNTGMPFATVTSESINFKLPNHKVRIESRPVDSEVTQEDMER